MMPMKKTLLLTMSMCSMLAMGQVSNFGTLSEQSGGLKSTELRGHTPMAYELMRYHANHPVQRVYESKSNVASDKAEIILEAHKVFGEFSKTGFQMVLDADASAYGTLFYDWSGGYYGTYDDFEYKIPENADASETSENVVYDGEVAIEVPAGTYDFMILYPMPGDGLIITGGEWAKYDDFEFKGGNTYRFVVEYAMGPNGWLTDMASLYTDVDAAITSLTLPPNSMDITDSEAITVEVTNRGTSAISGFTLSYQIDGGEAVTETYSETLEAGATATYTFAAKADLSVEKQYEIKAWVTLEGDMIASNDSMSGKCKHIGVSQLPYTNDFSTAGAEGFASDWIVENLNEDYSEWMYNEWTAGADGTMGVVSCSGCYGGDQTGNDNLISCPIYLPAGDVHAIFYTKCINGTETTELLDFRYGKTAVVSEMTIIGDYAINQTEWVQRIVNFNVEEAGVYYFAFRAKSVGGMNVFVDDLTIDAGFFEVSPKLSIEKVLVPYSNCDLSDASLIGARIKNIGTGPTSSFTLTYTVNGENKVIEKFIEEIEPTGVVDIYFKATADLAEVGEYAIYVTATTATEEESHLSATINCYEPLTELPMTTDFAAGENYNDYWTEMNEGAWNVDEYTGTFGTSVSGLENGLLARCFYLDKPVRVKLQYSKGGWATGRLYVAYGKSGTDLSTYAKVYENTNISGDTEVEFTIPIADPDSYSFVLVNESDPYCNLYLYTWTISEILEHDVRIENVTAPVAAYMPQNQVNAEGEYFASVNNRGSKDMTGVKVSLYNGETLLGSSEDGVAVAMGETKVIAMKATLPETAVGSTIDLTMKVEAAEADEYEADNSYAIPTINVTDGVYATENITEIVAGTGSWGSTLYVGNVYTVNTSDNLESVTIGFASVDESDTTTGTAKIGVAVYEVDSDLNVDNMLYSKTFERGFGGLTEIEFDAMKLNPGMYYFEVQQLSGTNMGLAYDSSNPAVNFCYQNIDGKLNKTQGAALLIRANFNSEAAVYEKDAKVVEFVLPEKKSALFSDAETVAVKVKNTGYTEAQIPVRLTINGVSYDTEISLAAYAEGVVRFPYIDMSAEGEYVAVAQTLLEGDEVAENNELTETFVTLEEANPYVMDFESCADFDAAPDTFNPRWTTVDRNNQPVDYYWRYEHKYRGEPVGFIAFNPEATTPAVNPEDLPGFFPNSGERFGAAFGPSYGTGVEVSDIWLISPKLQLETLSKLELYVKTRFLESADQQLEKYRILISDTDNEFENFKVLGDDVRSADTEWEKVEVDLAEYDGKEVYVAIQYVGEYLKNVCFMIDDIKVNTTSSVDTVLAEKLYVSHAADMLTVKSTIDVVKVEIVNLQGQVVEVVADLGEGVHNISTADYATGLYVAKVYTEVGTETVKFLVK